MFKVRHDSRVDLVREESVQVAQSAHGEILDTVTVDDVLDSVDVTPDAGGTEGRHPGTT